MKQILFICCAFVLYGVSTAQKNQYSVSLTNAIHHEAKIELNVPKVAIHSALIFKMRCSSPERYITHEFGKNVYDVMAKDLNGKRIPMNRID
jgi:predicted metalloprotease with PDZ domain